VDPLRCCNYVSNSGGENKVKFLLSARVKTEGNREGDLGKGGGDVGLREKGLGNHILTTLGRVGLNPRSNQGLPVAKQHRMRTGVLCMIHVVGDQFKENP